MSRVAEDSVALQIEVLTSQLNKESNESTKCAVLNHLFLPVFNRACESPVSDRIVLNTSIKMSIGVSIGVLSNQNVMADERALGSGYPHLKERLKRPLIDCLNDHTIDSRGDVGSDVRIAAINIISKTAAPGQWDDAFCHEASGIVYGLAVEKLDKVRGRAWSCVREVRYVNILFFVPNLRRAQSHQSRRMWLTITVDSPFKMCNEVHYGQPTAWNTSHSCSISPSANAHSHLC